MISPSRPVSEPIRPGFLYIGTAKAGSSWIYEILREHPDVFVPAAKDIQFFDYQYERGFEWYLSFFRRAGEAKAVGELGHYYFLLEKVAVRIHRHLPDVRLFCCLREPIDQLISNFLQRRATFLGKNETLDEAVFRKEFLMVNDYYFNLLPFYERFSREQILVLFFDDLKADSAQFARKLYGFLEVDQSFVPGTLNRKVLTAREPRDYGLAFLAYRTGAALRRLGLANTVGRVKRDPRVSRMLYKQTRKKPEFLSETREQLTEYYRERYQGLADLIGQPLPEGWPV